MTRLFCLVVILTIAGNAIGQAPPDGWEFLKWKTKKSEAGKIISQQSNIERGSMLDAGFDYNDMSTWLEYNNNEELVKVSQRKTFSVIHNDEAELFYKKQMEYMISKYGKPTEKKHDRKNDIITASWEFPSTKIDLEYDYKYKVIDELGAGSYWVKIVFESR